MKIDGYEGASKITPEYDDFLEDVGLLINFGKYQYQVVSEPPAWKAENGEAVLFTSANTHRWYFYLGGRWNSLEFSRQLINAWITFSGSAQLTVYDSFNVQSVTDNGTGDYTINWIVPFLTRSYLVIANPREAENGSAMFGRLANTAGGLANPLEGSVRLQTMEMVPSTPGNEFYDTPYMSVFAIGN